MADELADRLKCERLMETQKRYAEQGIAYLAGNSIPYLGRHRFELFEQFTETTRKRRSHLRMVFAVEAPAYFPQPQPSAVNRKPSRLGVSRKFRFHCATFESGVTGSVVIDREPPPPGSPEVLAFGDLRGASRGVGPQA